MRWLVDDAYPAATVVRVVLDNPNVHAVASLYVAFPPAESRRIARKLEFHYTPKHGSRLNVAECELAVLAGQCLARRLGDIDTARHEIATWERQRNPEQPTVTWHFTVAQARRKLQFLYPDRHERGGHPLVLVGGIEPSGSEPCMHGSAWRGRILRRGTQPGAGLIAARWLRPYRAGYRYSSEASRRRRRRR